MLLLAALPEEDRDFVARLFGTYHRLMTARLYRQTGDSQVTEDLLQEVGLALCRQVKHLRRLDSNILPAYIDSMCRYTAIDYLRRAQRERRERVGDGDSALGFVPSQAPGPEEQVMQQDRVARVQALMARLSPKEREALHLRYFLQLDNAAIAQALDIRPASLRVYIYRARAKLAAMLRAQEEENT